MAGVHPAPGGSCITLCPLFRPRERVPVGQGGRGRLSLPGGPLRFCSWAVKRGTQPRRRTPVGGTWIPGAEEGGRATGAWLAHPSDPRKCPRGSTANPASTWSTGPAVHRTGPAGLLCPLPAPSLSPVSTQLTHGEGPRGGVGGGREEGPHPLLSYKSQTPPPGCLKFILLAVTLAGDRKNQDLVLTVSDHRAEGPEEPRPAWLSLQVPGTCPAR